MKHLPVPCTLTVVVPVFNEGGTVRETLDKLLARQITGIQFEIMIVESNSTDGSRDIVPGYKADPRAKLSQPGITAS